MHMQVKQEYCILRDLAPIPAPHPIYCSTAADERIVGREFIIIEFVPVGSLLLLFHRDTKLQLL